MATWHNRIVGTGEEPPDQLLANPLNWRTHPRHQQEALSAALADVGWIQSVIVNRATGRMIDGHLRVSLALRHDEPTVPVTYVDLSDAEEALALATYDPIGSLAGSDAETLRALLDEVATDDVALLEMLDTIAGEAGVTRESAPLPGDPEAVPDPPADPVARPGDIRLLGDPDRGHRVICGDATEPTVVDRLFAGDRAGMVWTDPPYGVGIGNKNRWLNSVSPADRIEENLANDTLGASELRDLLRGAFAVAAGHCTPGAAWYVASPPGPLHLQFAGVLDDLGILRQMIVWVKHNATFAPLGVSYHWRHEPIFYGWLPNGAHRYYGDRKQDTVWEIDRPAKSPDHPTTKPVELVARAIRHSTVPGEIVYDAFLGSGTTIIAAEQEGRRCIGCELDPAYVDVIVRRWQDATGGTAERLRDGDR